MAKVEGDTVTLAELAAGTSDTEVVGIDEGQFFDNELVRVANELAQRGVRVIIAGLDQDYTGKPWEPMPQLLSIAEYIAKTHAICMKCGQPANYTQRKFDLRRTRSRRRREHVRSPLPSLLRPAGGRSYRA